jgi:type IV pilus assembly protein PilQ
VADRQTAPVESPAAFTYEPLPRPAAEGPALDVRDLDSAPPAPTAQLAQADPSASGVGTADNPVMAPPPSGVIATRLEGVEVLGGSGGSVLQVTGDGEFRYSFFSLDNPERFVIDLEGVVNHSRHGAVQVGDEVVERVRIAQFKPAPDPISRVVFDLNRPAVPRIERTSDGLIVRFGGAAPELAEAAPEREAPLPGDAPAVEPTGSMADTGAAAAGMEPEPEAGLETEDLGDSPTNTSLAFLEPDSEPAPPPPQVEREPVPEVVPPPTSRETEVPLPAPTSPRPPSPTIRREPPTPAAAVSEEGSFDVQTVSGSETQYVGEPINMTVRDADVVEVLRMFAQISGLNVVIQPGVRGTVTVELNNVPWDQALEQILKINGLGFELEGNIMRIAPIETLRKEAEERQRLEQAKALSIPLRTIIRRLSYANATQVAALLRARGGILSQRGSVIVDRRTNTMIIKELPDFMDTVIAVIENLDTPEPQVMIEARIVETSKRFTRTLGINWELGYLASPELGNTTGLTFPANIDSTAGVNLLTGGNNALVGLTLGNILNTFTLDATLQAAETEGLINILSAPKVATLNNERATIQSGLQIPIQTVANNTVTVQFINATLELSVTPQVTAEGTILMDIQIAKREPQLAFAVQGANNAPISTKEARTRVIVRDGGTTVIGGIYEVSTDQGEDRVPGLSNIPIIGHLFRNRRRTDENEELLIFITPRVINL